MQSNEDKAAEYEGRGDQLIQRVCKPKNERLEDACECYTKAATCYKIAKKYTKSAENYLKIAQLQQFLKNDWEVASNFVEASRSYKLAGQHQESINNLKIAIPMLLEEGKFSSAARHTKEIAELYLNLGLIENAISSFQEAADIYIPEGETSSGNSCRIKVAELSAQIKQYSKASEVFEQIAVESMSQNNLQRFAAKILFLKAGLCILAVDVVAARKAIERFNNTDVSFAGAKEGQFLEELTKTCESNDEDAFNSFLAKYQQEIDAWKTSVLLDIKKEYFVGLA